MGWNSVVTSNKTITTEDVQKVVESLPKEFGMKQEKQSWGWPCYGDIMKPSGNRLTIGGSCSMSGTKAEEFTEAVTNKLKDIGHEATASKVTF